MRLICGLVRLDGGPADPASVRAMAAAMTTPGLRPRLALRAEGPAALAVLDFAAPPGLPPDDLPDDLPVAEDGTWIAADARLDEPVDLAAAVMRFGADLPGRLLGDFAVAAWHPGRRQLICARDVTGVRPLAWHHRPGRLVAFASLPKGLALSGVAPADPDLVGLGRILADAIDPDGRTAFREVSRLPADHALVVTPGTVRLHRAWAPDPAEVGRRRIGHADAAAELRHLVEQAVRCRLPAAGPAATQLSGGLDSGAIAVIAARILRGQGRPLHAFSLLPRPVDGLDEPAERPFIEAVLAQEPDIRWQAIHPPSVADPDPASPDMLSDPVLLSFFERSARAAAAAGSSLLLSGGGGDEGATYNGAAIYATLLRQGRWRPLVLALTALAARERRPLAQVAIDRLVRPLLPERLVVLRRRLDGRPPPRSPHRNQRQALDFLTPDLRRQVAATLSRGPKRRNRSEERIAMFTRGYLAGRNDHLSILAARHGVAYSAPLQDRRIVDFVLSLPLERFLADGLARQPYREAMIGVLPEAVRTRVDKSFSMLGLLVDIAATKARLIEQVEALRSSPAAEHVDLSAIAATLAAFPDRDETWMMVQRGLPDSFDKVQILQALTALSLARYLARGL